MLSKGRCKRTEDEWRQILVRFQRSGQSGLGFFQKEGIEFSSFQRWLRRLEGVPAARDFVTVTAVPEGGAAWTMVIVLPNIGTVRFQGRS